MKENIKDIALTIIFAPIYIIMMMTLGLLHYVFVE